MKPLRIAIVRQRYTPDGGAERFVARALGALQAQGVALTLLARRWQPAAGIDVVPCDPLYLGSLWRDWSFARCVCRALRGREVDLVQSHERIACCDVYRAGDGVHREWLAQRSRALGALGRLRLALSPYHYYMKAAEKRLFASPRLRAVICNSHMVKDEIKRYFAVPDGKLHVVYNGVDTARFHPDLRRHRDQVRSRYRIPHEATLFLFVGSGFERKGLAALIDALAQGPAPAHLLVVGKDKRSRRFYARARSQGVAGRVHFAGVQKDVGPFYGAADAFVLPTLYDPFPNVTLEAMAAGLPVITSTKCGAAELVRDGDNGAVVDALDIPALARALNRFADPVVCQQAGQRARATVEPLNLHAMGETLVALYRRLLAP